MRTGSLVNDIYAESPKGEPAPTVGLGVTMLLHSDRHAGTIARVFKIGSAAAVEVTRDRTKRIDKNGMSECQEYEYTTDPGGARYVFKQLGGRWVEMHKRNPSVNRWSRVSGGSYLALGIRREYYNFSF